MLQLWALIPKIMAAIELIDKIKTALASGKNILQIFQEMGEEVLRFFTDVAQAMFPNLKPEQQAAAGVLMADTQAVINVQTALNTLETAGLKVDGAYGPLTKAAVTAFQTKHGLTADGWAGSVTQAKIQMELAKLKVPEEVAKAEAGT